jgi:hypothetical protein
MAATHSLRWARVSMSSYSSRGPQCASDLNPPQVAEGVARPADPVTEEQVRHLGHRSSPGLQRLLVHGVAIFDVQPKEARRFRPIRFRVEHHHHRIADPDLGMSDAAILDMDASQLLRVERLFHEIEKPRGGFRDDPRRDSVIPLRESAAQP